MQIGLADMPLFHADLLLLNHDSCLPLLMAREGEVERGVQPRRLAWLEDVWHSFQENLDGVRPQGVAHKFDLFVGKPLGDMILSVGIPGDVNRLFLLLKGPHDILEMRLPIGEERSNDIFSGRADRQAVRGFVVRPVGQTLPHRSRLRIADPTAVVVGILAVGHLLDPIGEAAHELPVVMGVAGREVKISFW